MELKPGYKRTEVGVIPDDWEVKPLHTLADKIMVGIASAATHAYRDRGIVLFRNQNIKVGRLDDSDILHVAEDYEVGFCKPFGEGDKIGKIGVYSTVTGRFCEQNATGPRNTW